MAKYQNTTIKIYGSYLQVVETIILDQVYESCSLTNSIIRKGFLYDFMKTVLFKPLLTMIGREKVKKWFENQDTVPLPDEKEVFKSGTSFVNYIHLQVSLIKSPYYKINLSYDQVKKYSEQSDFLVLCIHRVWIWLVRITFVCIHL